MEETNETSGGNFDGKLENVEEVIAMDSGSIDAKFWSSTTKT